MKLSNHHDNTLVINHIGLPRYEIPILLDAGVLCLGPVWDKEVHKAVHGLYFIYFKRFGARIGPYYASLSLAERDMRKMLKEFPPGAFWEQSLEWYQRQGKLHDWIDKRCGKPEYLIGGTWAPEEVKNT